MNPARQIVVESYTLDHTEKDGFTDIVGYALPELLNYLRQQRRSRFGNIGGLTAELSDGTQLAVELQYCSDGSQLMSSQQMLRRAYNSYLSRYQTLRKYNW